MINIIISNIIKIMKKKDIQKNWLKISNKNKKNE